MQISAKFIFISLIAVILFAPLFNYNVFAVSEENTHQSNESINHEKEAGENASILMTEEHHSSRIWPHYGKMVIFAEIMFAFMLFSFIAPLAHFYIKGEKHH